ncbi:hypothetical protein Daus18300_009664 [Diaporthe australafricana]|uniref:Methyltransferase type 11 domain-containing protein n=1 Tax=Diaporthe australafricana TaxID=127596 RepID=A0ABR3WDF4_9PEZI
MILSDPSEYNLTTAREILRANHYPGAELSFHQKMGEDSFLEPDSVDMVIACECLHYTDIGKAIVSIHSSLRPGGTMASVFYSVLSSRIYDDERADAAWRAFAQMHYKRLLDEKVETIFARVIPSQLGVGLNFVSMESDKWKDVKRIFFNVPSGKTEWPLEVGLEELMKAKGTSRIDPEYDSLEWRSDSDGWGIEDCTVERIREMLVSWHLDYDEKDWQSEEWREFEAAVNGACGKCHFVFPATMILGRKK